MSDRQQSADRPGATERDDRVAPPDRRDRYGSLGTPIADQVQQTPGVMGEAVLEVLMTLLRGNSRLSRRAGRRARVGMGLIVLVAGALLARAQRNRAARNGAEGNQVVHMANQKQANPVNVVIVRVARAEVGNRELTGAIRTAIASNPDIPSQVRAHIAGPDGDRAIDGVLASMDVRHVASALRLTKRQEELIDRCSEQWNSGLGFEGRFEDAWKYALANPAIGDPDGVGLPDHSQEAWRRFAEWDPATQPTEEVLNHLNAAWLSSIASLDGEAVGARQRIETLIARWEPQLYEASTRSLVQESARTGWTDPDSMMADRISAVENAALHADRAVSQADGGRPNLAEQWASIAASPSGLRELDKRELRDLVDAWTTHGGLRSSPPTALMEPALRSLAQFSEQLLAANPEIGADYLRRTQTTRDPFQAFADASRRSTGHPFDPDSRLVPRQPPAEQTEGDQVGVGAYSVEVGARVKFTRIFGTGEEPRFEDFRRLDAAEPNRLDLDSKTLSRYSTEGRRRERTDSRHATL